MKYRQGQSLAEYVLILAVVALTVIGIAIVLGLETSQAVQTVPAPNATWQASEAVQFKVGTSVFLLLSYADIDAAGADVFKVTTAQHSRIST